MHVVCLGLDPKTLDPESVVAFRNRAYGALVDHYSIVVPAPETQVVRLSDRTTVYGVGGTHKALQLFGVFRRTRALIRAGKCDVVSAQDMYFLGFLGLLLARWYHLGLEVQVLGIEKLTPLRRMIATFVLPRASVVRALSERIKGRLITEFGVSESLIKVVTIFVDVAKLGLDVRTLTGTDATTFASLTESFRSAYGDSVNFLSVSRLVPIKRIELQLTALAKLALDVPQVRLHIVGDGPSREALALRVRELGLTEHVVFHGYRTGYELGMFYMECDCFLLTSDYEGWGMVIIEAATAGLPVIMTDVGCAGELIRDGESGIVVPPGDADAIEVAMRRIATDAALRDTLSVGATRAIAHLPTFAVVLQAYRENWERAAAHPL